MESKAKLIIRVVYIFVCITGGIGFMSHGILGILTGIILIAAGLIMIPPITNKIPVLREKGGSALAASIVLFFTGVVISPSSGQESTDPGTSDKSIILSGETTTADTTAESDTTQTTTTTESTTSETTATEESTTTVKTTATTTAKATTTKTSATNKTTNTKAPAATQGTTASVSLSVTSFPNTVHRNEDVTLTAKGKPNTEYTIKVFYSSGASKADGLEKHTSDSNGNVSWTWQIGGKTNAGTYKITISGGKETITIPFTVAVE